MGRRIRISTGTASAVRGLGNALIRRYVPPEYQDDARAVVGGAAEALVDGVQIEVQVGHPRKPRRLRPGRS